MLGIDEESNRPDAKNAQGQPLDDDKLLRADRAEGQR